MKKEKYSLWLFVAAAALAGLSLCVFWEQSSVWLIVCAIILGLCFNPLLKLTTYVFKLHQRTEAHTGSWTTNPWFWGLFTVHVLRALACGVIVWGLANHPLLALAGPLWWIYGLVCSHEAWPIFSNRVVISWRKSHGQLASETARQFRLPLVFMAFFLIVLFPVRHTPEYLLSMHQLELCAYYGPWFLAGHLFGRAFGENLWFWIVWAMEIHGVQISWRITLGPKPDLRFALRRIEHPPARISGTEMVAETIAPSVIVILYYDPGVEGDDYHIGV